MHAVFGAVLLLICDISQDSWLLVEGDAVCFTSPVALIMQGPESDAFIFHALLSNSQHQVLY